MKQQQSGGNQNASNGSVSNISFGLGVSSNMALGNIANSGLQSAAEFGRGQHEQITLPGAFSEMSISKVRNTETKFYFFKLKKKSIMPLWVHSNLSLNLISRVICIII